VSPAEGPDHHRPCCRRADRGSLTVELIVLTPVFVLFVLVALAFGRFELARQQAVAGARAAADAAAVAGSSARAQQGAVAAAMPVLRSNHSCTDPHIVVESQSLSPGTMVKVSVSCRIDFADLLVPGFPGSTTVRAVQTAPIDPYRTINP
jgi:Flp pilus assembly protein TadG